MVKQISAILLAMIFLISSSGFLIYKSYCACTGNEQVSVFVSLETCSSEEVSHTESSKEESCCSTMESTECKDHSADCECDLPEVTFLKVKDQVVTQEFKLVKAQSIELLATYFTVSLISLTEENSDALGVSYIDPPPLASTSLDFLIQIQQLKVPLSA